MRIYGDRGAREEKSGCFGVLIRTFSDEKRTDQDLLIYFRMHTGSSLVIAGGCTSGLWLPS
jgi:hypothetical protein